MQYVYFFNVVDYDNCENSISFTIFRKIFQSSNFKLPFIHKKYYPPVSLPRNCFQLVLFTVGWYKNNSYVFKVLKHKFRQLATEQFSNFGFQKIEQNKLLKKFSAFELRIYAWIASLQFYCEFKSFPFRCNT